MFRLGSSRRFVFVLLLVVGAIFGAVTAVSLSARAVSCQKVCSSWTKDRYWVCGQLGTSNGRQECQRWREMRPDVCARWENVCDSNPR